MSVTLKTFIKAANRLCFTPSSHTQTSPHPHPRPFHIDFPSILYAPRPNPIPLQDLAPQASAETRESAHGSWPGSGRRPGAKGGRFRAETPAHCLSPPARQPADVLGRRHQLVRPHTTSKSPPPWTLPVSHLAG